MGRLAGFKYREISKRLKKLGFQFDRHAVGSHEIWYNPTTNRYTTIPNHTGDMPDGTSLNKSVITTAESGTPTCRVLRDSFARGRANFASSLLPK